MLPSWGTGMEMRTEPITGPSVWRADELEHSDEWIYRFSDADLDELERGVELVGGRDVHGLAPDAFPLPGLEARIKEFVDELDTGRGFIVLRGLPMGPRFDHAAAAAVFWAICSRVGRLVPTTSDGALLNHVWDRGPGQDPNARAYSTNIGGHIHSDGVEIVGLMCLRPSTDGGGVSIVASSMTMFNTLLEEHPEWLPILFKRMACDWKMEEPPGNPGWYPQSLYCYVDGWLSATLKTGFQRSAQRFDGVEPLTDDEFACFEYLESIPERPGVTLHMDLEAGDIQLVNNYVTLHSRTAYTDDPARPEQKRHMLRYWMSRSGLSPRAVSADYQFMRDDYFGLTQPAPLL